jgi:hypothetical protein
MSSCPSKFNSLDASSPHIAAKASTSASFLFQIKSLMLLPLTFSRQVLQASMTFDSASAHVFILAAINAFTSGSSLTICAILESEAVQNSRLILSFKVFSYSDFNTSIVFCIFTSLASLSASLWIRSSIFH